MAYKPSLGRASRQNSEPISLARPLVRGLACRYLFMRKPRFQSLLGFTVISCLFLAQAAQPAEPAPKRLKRADSFLGVHYDFHAGPDCTEIGRNTTPAMVENIIRQIQPDYLQIDCKGHRGLSSYPTKVGNPAPGFVGDPLRVWRDATAKNGVALYMHYSGVWDSEAIIQHPAWGVINSDGKTNGNATSFNSPYVDELLIPQLRELAGVYGVDGAWLDGECWASAPDYGTAMVQAFQQATGAQEVPRKPGDPKWFEWLEFNREAFRKYLRHYIAEVKKTNPDFQLCSNWAFTDHMPEPVCAPLDFLSGDYSPQDSVNSARLSARFLARQGKPWDLMAWSFTTTPNKDGRNEKSAVQLQREAAVVLAMGGGFQAYFKQKRDGSVFDERVPVMAEVAKFCRARQSICHHAVQVPQIAVLFSTPAHYRMINGLFSRDPSRFRGTLESLIESQHSVELLGEHHLDGRLKEYPLVIIPEWEYLDPAFQQELVSYVKGGGNLLLVGPKTAQMFQAELGVTLDGDAQQISRVLDHKGTFANTKGWVQSVTLAKKTQQFGVLRGSEDTNTPGQPAASIAKLGKGKIAAIWFSYSQGYLAGRPQPAREFLSALVQELFPKPMVQVTGGGVDVIVNRINGKLAVNLINTSGPHETQPVIDEISPTGPINMTIRGTGRPKSVVLQPAGTKLPFEYRQGEIQLTLPRVEIHDIVVVE